MEKYLKIIVDSCGGYPDYLWQAISTSSWNNYFYWLLGTSAVFMLLEWVRPWRKDQPKFRKDFWLDFLYLLVGFLVRDFVSVEKAKEVAHAS